MTIDFHVIIPARYNSSRLPGKLLMDLGGRSIIRRVYEQAKKADPKSILIATDSTLIAEHVSQFNAQVCLTSTHHQSGTERLVEAVSKEQFGENEIIVNLQGDEPLIPPELIKQVAQSLSQSQGSMATLCWPIESSEQFHNPNVVKVIRDSQQNALYFSRSPIPFFRDEQENACLAYRHIGLYAYRVNFLRHYLNLPRCSLERIEALEQLRVLWAGHKITVEEACVKPSQDINIFEDLHLAEQQLL